VQTLKGLAHKMNIFLKTYTIKSVLFIHAQWVLNIQGWLIKEKNKYNVSASVFFRKPRQNFCSSLPCLSYAIFSSVHCTVHGKYGFGNNFQDHRQLSEQLYT
jgi:hypothetical protein